MSDEAKVKIDVEGEAEAKRKLKSISDGFKDWGRTIGGIVAGVATNLGSMSLELARVDPGQAAQKFRDFRRTVTEMSVASGRSVQDLKSQFAGLSDKTLLPDEQVADFSQALGRATYDFNDSRKAVEALRGSGLATGRSLEEMGSIAETLHNQMGVSFSDIPDMLGTIEASAKSLGTTGGPAALMDDLQALGGVLSQVSTSGKRGAADLVGVMAAIGKGRSVDQARQVQQSLVGRFAAGGEQMRLNLGIKRKDFYDENGNVKVNAENVQRLRDFYLKRTGGDVERAKSLASFSGNLGPQLATALFRPGLVEDLKKAEATRSTAGPDALAKLRASQHGIETARENARDRETRENVGAKANAAQQAVANAAPGNSLARMLLTGVGGGVASAVTSAVATKGFEKAAGLAAKGLFSVNVAGEKAALGLSTFGRGALGIAGKLGLVGAAGAAGYAVGTYLDNKLGLSTKIANALDRDSAKKEEAGVAANREQLSAKEAARQKRVKELEAQGLDKGRALYYADHPNEKPPVAAKPAPFEVNVKIEDASGHPNQVVQVQKGAAGKQ
jgi:hypothetical protein